MPVRFFAHHESGQIVGAGRQSAKAGRAMIKTKKPGAGRLAGPKKFTRRLSFLSDPKFLSATKFRSPSRSLANTRAPSVKPISATRINSAPGNSKDVAKNRFNAVRKGSNFSDVIVFPAANLQTGSLSQLNEHEHGLCPKLDRTFREIWSMRGELKAGQTDASWSAFLHFCSVKYPKPRTDECLNRKHNQTPWLRYYCSRLQHKNKRRRQLQR